MNVTKIISLIARLLAAFILLQTLYFKFTAAPESVYIFSQLGMEPVGRIGTGIAELFASILLLIPSTSWIGALVAFGLMSGAVFFHLTVLGIEIMNDRGQLFIYGILVLICSAFILWNNRQKIINLINQKLK